MNKLILSVLLGPLLSSHAFALQNYYCPTNAGTIRLGMSQAEVVSFCGKPTRKSSQKVFVRKSVPALQLYYRIGGNNVNPLNLATANPQSGRKTSTIMVTFVNNKAASISLNGSSIPSASVCQKPIKTGDTVSQINRACGAPYLTNQTTTGVGEPKQEKVSSWFYQFNPYQSISLTFQAGILKSISK
jgi:hypothetical protein